MTLDWLSLAHRQADRFWSKVTKTDGCWLWNAGKCRDGYGKFAITAPAGVRPKQRHVKAHRLAWELVNGLAPVGLVIMHSCDHPSCVNPGHLSPGTQADNRADCVTKGRNAYGERSGSRLHPERLPRGDSHWTHKSPEKVPRGEARATSVLTTAIVREIRAMRRSGAMYKDIARKLGVGKSVVGQVVRGETWKHLL